MSRHPSHDPHAVTGNCIRCGMTHEEMLDFDLIECEDARTAQLPMGDERRLSWFGELPLTEQRAHQRGLMIEGLWSRAWRTRQSGRRFEAYDLQAIEILWPREIPIPQFVGDPGARKVTAWPAGFSMAPEPPAPLTDETIVAAAQRCQPDVS